MSAAAATAARQFFLLYSPTTPSSLFPGLFCVFVKKEKKGMREKKERVFARLRKKVLIAFL